MTKRRWRYYSKMVSPFLLVSGLAVLFFGLFQEVVGNKLSDYPFWFSLLVVTTPLILVGILLPLLAPDVEVKSKIETRTLRTAEEQQRYANRALIIFVSLYRPIIGSPPAGVNDSDWLEAARALEYDKLDLEKSNLATAIKAVMSHSSRLAHCWLIGTSSADGSQPGSADYEPVLIEYLKKEKGLTCEFHSGIEYAIPLDDDALVCLKTYDLVQRIYREAKERFEIEPREMIADFTGCPRSMTLGLILSCLGEDQNIQLMGTRYDLAGRPSGPVFPIIFNFEPLLQTLP